MSISRADPVQTAASEEDSRTLVARIREGDDEAFRTFYRMYARLVAGTVHRLLGQDAELEDVVQETFFSAYGALDQLREPDRVGSWLCSIAVRHVYKRLKKKRKKRALDRQVSHVRLAEQDGDKSSPELALALYAALDGLDPKLRVPWILRHVEERELAEVAELCAISLATVKRRLSRAQKRLQRRLGHG